MRYFCIMTGLRGATCRNCHQRLDKHGDCGVCLPSALPPAAFAADLAGAVALLVLGYELFFLAGVLQ